MTAHIRRLLSPLLGVFVFLCAFSPAQAQVTPGPLSPPILKSPISGALASPEQNLSFTWQPTATFSRVESQNVASYELEISLATGAAFPNNVIHLKNDISTSDTTFTYTPLYPAQTHYWRMRARSMTGTYGPWSVIQSFKMRPYAPTLSQPADGDESMMTLRPTFEWFESGGGSYTVSGFSLQIATSSTFASGVSTIAVPSSRTTHTLTSNLREGTKYYWRVITNTSIAPSAPSSVSQFTTPDFPSAPVLVGPANTQTVYSQEPTMSWKQQSPAPAQYILEAADSNGTTIGTRFADTIFHTDTVEGTATSAKMIPLQVQGGKFYYWRVRAIGHRGEEGPYSPIWSFRVSQPPPDTLFTPVIAAPKGGETVYERPIIFRVDCGISPNNCHDWEYQKTYDMQVSTTSSFSSLIHSSSVTGYPDFSFFDFDSDKIKPNSTYYWRVRVRFGGKSTAWTAPQQFKTGSFEAGIAGYPESFVTVSTDDKVIEFTGNIGFQNSAYASSRSFAALTYRARSTDAKVKTFGGFTMLKSEKRGELVSELWTYTGESPSYVRTAHLWKIEMQGTTDSHQLVFFQLVNVGHAYFSGFTPVKLTQLISTGGTPTAATTPAAHTLSWPATVMTQRKKLIGIHSALGSGITVTSQEQVDHSNTPFNQATTTMSTKRSTIQSGDSLSWTTSKTGPWSAIGFIIAEPGK